MVVDNCSYFQRRIVLSLNGRRYFVLRPIKFRFYRSNFASHESIFMSIVILFSNKLFLVNFTSSKHPWMFRNGFFSCCYLRYKTILFSFLWGLIYIYKVMFGILSRILFAQYVNFQHSQTHRRLASWLKWQWAGHACHKTDSHWSKLVHEWKLRLGRNKATSVKTRWFAQSGW